MTAHELGIIKEQLPKLYRAWQKKLVPLARLEHALAFAKIGRQEPKTYPIIFGNGIPYHRPEKWGIQLKKKG